MAMSRDKAEWNRVSGVIASIRNAFSDGKRVIKPEDCTPYGKSSQNNSIPLRRDNLHVLKQFTKAGRCST